MHSAVEIDSKSSCLSLDWAEPTSVSAAPCAVLSLSSGHLSIIRARPETFQVTDTWHAHSLETWTAAFNLTQPELIYSGADDALLKAWDLRVSTDYPVFQNNIHRAGVTVVTPHPSQAHLLATGSYDEAVRLFDTRAMRQPFAEHNTFGGVWRVRWHPRAPSLLVTASMRNGFHVLKAHIGMEGDMKAWGALDSVASDGSILGLAQHLHASEEESLAYGCDWSRLDCGTGRLAASCSFYDRRLTLWTC
jgi:diphthamide biosynthesis protein 7